MRYHLRMILTISGVPWSALEQIDPEKVPLMRLLISSIAVAVLLSSPALADERPDHFRGKPAESLDQALENFVATNASIADLLERDELDLVDLAAIHELTYTLENALERIDEEYDRLEEQLEELHLASEGADVERARQLGQRYLDNAARFLP